MKYMYVYMLSCRLFTPLCMCKHAHSKQLLTHHQRRDRSGCKRTRVAHATLDSVYIIGQVCNRTHQIFTPLSIEAGVAERIFPRIPLVNTGARGVTYYYYYKHALRQQIIW